jgi:hypothetical protein
VLGHLGVRGPLADLGWNAHGDRARRHDHVVEQDGVGGNDGAATNDDVVQHDRSDADKYVAFDSARFEMYQMADNAIIADRRSDLGGGVDDAAVLHRGAISDRDGHSVASEHGAWPHRTLCADGDVADNDRLRMNERACIDGRFQLTQGIDRHTETLRDAIVGGWVSHRNGPISAEQLALFPMSRRIELELTSNRGDGTWTWRAVGAREPKGILNGTLLPGDAKVGDTHRAEADFDLDGITVLSVLPAKGARKEAAKLELMGSSKPFEPVLQTLAAKGSGPRRDFGDRADRPPRGDRPDRPPRGPRPEGAAGDRPPRGPRTEGDRPPRGPRPEGDRPARGPRPEGDRGPRQARPAFAEAPQKPKAKRLRAGKTHRNAVLAALPEEHKPIAEQVLRGGIPAVRQALSEQNDALKAAGQSEIKPAGVLQLAETLLPSLRVAEWLDRAEAAKADVQELDLRDLRSVVVAGDEPIVAREESTRVLAADLKAALNLRQENEHSDWLGEITDSIKTGKSIRALRLSSRPPKAGVRFPPELSVQLAAATITTLSPDAGSDRWVAVLDALAFSPVRNQVVPTGIPANPSDELQSTVKRLARQLPAIAAMFGVDAPAGGTGRAPRPPRKPGLRPPAPPAKGESASTVTETLTAEAPTVDTVETVVTETPTAIEAPVVIAAVEAPAEVVVETPAAVETVVAAPAALETVAAAYQLPADSPGVTYRIVEDPAEAAALTASPDAHVVETPAEVAAMVEADHVAHGDTATEG